MNSIYELSAEFMELQQMLEDGEIDEEVFLDTLAAIEGEIEMKADAYAKILKNLEAQQNGLNSEADRLKARADSIKNNMNRMKAALESAMRLTGKTKFKTDLFSFNIQKNPASVFIPDDSRVPEEFLVPQPPKVNKTAIKDFLKGLGENDVCEWAELVQTEGLRIR